MMPFPTLRELREDDASTVRAWLEAHLADHLRWWQQAYGTPAKRTLPDLVARDWQELVSASTSPDQFVRVLGESTALGIVLAHKRQDRYMGFEIGVLGWIYVEAAARGQGLAPALMAAANTWMTAQGVRGREVFVTASNSSAVKLYECHGYQVVDHRMLSR